MSFSLSSVSIHIKPGGVLEARCRNRNGVKKQSCINLNKHIGNREGKFDLGSQNFVASARNVRLEGNKTLCADLESSDRQWHQDFINLDAFIGNHDGKLVFCERFDPDLLRPRELARPVQESPPLPDSTAHGPPSAPEPVQCNLCDDWPRKREGQGRVSRVPQITPANINSAKRRRECVTCKLAERVMWKMIPNLFPSAQIVQESIKIGLYMFSLPELKIEFTTLSGEKVERSCTMCTKPEDQNFTDLYRDVPAAKLLSGSSTSHKTISMVKGWLDACAGKHEKCQDTRKSRLPARILDIGTKFEDGVKLKTTAPGEKQTYACLSHCWGKTETLTLTEHDLDSLHKDIPWGCLQKTYTEAITLCRSLGVRYIWIDALCIIQDSAEDWKRESAKMHSYYGNCFVCIAATSAADHDGGCSVRNLSMKHQGTDEKGKPYCIYLQPEVPHIMHDIAYPHGQFFPLLTRAWVYQERRLSPRVLHVTEMELFFECNTVSECECGESGNQPFLQTSTWTKAQEAYYASHQDVSEVEDGIFKAEHEWRSFVRAYSRLDITKPTDRLPALSGLAQVSHSKRETHKATTGRYLAGCWEGSLINDMAWAVGPELRRFVRRGSSFQFLSMPWIPNTYRTAKRPKPADYIAPSWSWAAIMDQVEYPPFGYSEYLCQVHGADVHLEGRDLYGQVKSGFLLVRAQLVPTRWKWQKSWRGRYAWLSDITTRQLMGLKKSKGIMWWRDWADGDAHKLLETEEMYLMPLATRTILGKTEGAEFNFKLNPGVTVTETAYLVLRKVGAENDLAVYERVGWASHSGMSGGPDIRNAGYVVLKLI